MDQALARMQFWMAEGRPMVWLALAALVAICFVVFNTIRIALYLPQLRTCMKDAGGCRAINLWTWTSWIVANASTALYMLMFLGDPWAAMLNLGNALMCGSVVAVTLVKRHRHARVNPERFARTAA